MGLSRATRSFVAAAALLTLPRAALARCGEPEPFAAPGHGATLPPVSTVYVFVPPSQSPSAVRADSPATIDVAGDGDLSWRVEPGPGPTGIPVYGVALRTTGRRVTITVQGNQRDALGARSDANPSRAFTYVVDPSWRAPVGAQVTAIRDATWRRSHWTCSFTDLLSLLPSVDAPLYRVSWASSEAEFDRGEGRSVLVPRRDGPGSAPLVEVGHRSCVGANLPAGVRTSDLAFVGVAAVYPDGTEVPAEAARRLPSQPEMTRAHAGVAPAPWWDDPRAFLALLALGLLGSSALFLRGRARSPAQG